MQPSEVGLKQEQLNVSGLSESRAAAATRQRPDDPLTRCLLSKELGQGTQLLHNVATVRQVKDGHRSVLQRLRCSVTPPVVLTVTSWVIVAGIWFPPATSGLTRFHPL